MDLGTPWEFPVLCKLVWKSILPDGGLHFLLRNRFNKLARVSWIINNMGNSDSNTMVSLLHRHPHLGHVTVCLNQAHFTKALPHAQAPLVSMDDTKLSKQVMHNLSPNVQTLTLANNEMDVPCGHIFGMDCGAIHLGCI
jgi:hypothetical protein